MRFAATLAFLAIFLFNNPLRAQDAKKGSEDLTIAGTKIVMKTPEIWKKVPPKNNMIDNEFRFPAEGDEFVRLTISRSGGTIDQNLSRWKGQFAGLKEADSKVEKKEIAKLPVHVFEATGTYSEMNFGGGPPKKFENYTMIGIIIETGTGANAYIKATGPKDLVAKTKDAMMKMVEGLKN
jgi:hypothetical protein